MARVFRLRDKRTRRLLARPCADKETGVRLFVGDRTLRPITSLAKVQVELGDKEAVPDIEPLVLAPRLRAAPQAMLLTPRVARHAARPARRNAKGRPAPLAIGI